MTRLISEEVEPTFARIVGVMFARCEAAKGEHELYHACNSFWWAVHGMNKIAIAVSGTRENKTDCLHLSLATNNHIRMVARYVEDKLGFNPMDKKDDRDWDI